MSSDSNLGFVLPPMENPAPCRKVLGRFADGGFARARRGGRGGRAIGQFIGGGQPGFTQLRAERLEAREHAQAVTVQAFGEEQDRKSTRLNSSHLGISYAV